MPDAGLEIAGPLVVNEILTSNHTGLTDADDDYSDWVEIYNRSSQPVNLSGWSLTDDPAQPQKWVFPDLTLGAHEYLVVFASGKDRTTGKELHASFKLSSNSGFLALYSVLNEQFVPVSGDAYPRQFPDIAFGLNDKSYRYLATPTPGQPNESTGWADLVSPVEFSVPRGFYRQPFTLTLTTQTPDAAIFFTTDGSEPGEANGQRYRQPIAITTTASIRARAIKPDYLPSYMDTHTYIFPEAVLRQPAAPPNFPATWGTHSLSIWEYKAGEPVAADYEMDPQVVNDPAYRETLVDDLQAIPTLSLVTATPDLFALYSNPQGRGPDWERPVSAELIYPDGTAPGFQINAGIRIHGARGREEYIPKHSFRLFFRSGYGAPRLEYPLFPNSPAASFDTLILRGGVNRSYAGQIRKEKSGFEEATYTRDQWLRESQIEMSGVGAHGIFVHLYLNGLYWGLYNLVERPDAAFMATYFGGNEADWLTMNAGGPINQPPERFEQLQLQLYEVNQLEPAQQYPALRKMIDTAHLADYIILNWYAGTRDWPHNNWYAGILPPDGQIRHFIWDGEVTWQEGARITFGDGDNFVKQLFNSLMRYPDFRVEFADRLYKHLHHNGALTDKNSQTRWLRLTKLVEQAIVGESARWGDARYEQPITQADWYQARDNVLAQMVGNGDKLIKLAREQGFYPPLDPPAFNPPGDEVIPPGTPLEMTAAGDIYFTTDGTDPRAAGSGQPSATAQRYSTPLTITATTRLLARTLSGENWSALNEADFFVAQPDRQVVISEIMYHPPEGNDYEFLELHNAGIGEVDLSNMTFEGIEYTFPVNTRLHPGERLVLAANAAAFAQRYPGVVIGGEYVGKLSNSGETVAIKNVSGQIITAVSYGDNNGWPLSADGKGDSLELINPAVSPNLPQNWRASPHLGGSPGVGPQPNLSPAP